MINFFLFVREYRGIQIRFWWIPSTGQFQYVWDHAPNWDYSFAVGLAEIRTDAVLSVDRMIDRNRARQKAQQKAQR